MAGKMIYRGTIEVPNAKTNKEAVNLGQVKDLVNRYYKEPVKVATTEELAGSYLDGVLTLSKDVNTIDGVTLEVGDSILVKDELDKTKNGIYVVTDLGTTGTPSNAVASVGSSTGITAATVDKTVLETKITGITAGDYVFTYVDTNSSWQYESTDVTLADYGIVATGVPADGDEITVTYTEVTLGTGGVLTRREDFAEGKTILNNTFVNVMEGTIYGDSRFTIVSDGVLVAGTASIIFIKDIDTEGSSISVVKATITGDGITKEFSVSHNLNLDDEYAYILKIRDGQGNEVYVDNVPKTSDAKNAIALTFDSIPEPTETFKVYVLGLE